MKIKEIKEDRIIFDNGNQLISDHVQDCCEHVFADFKNMQVLTKIISNSINSEDLDFYEDLEHYIYKIKDIGFEIEDKNGIRLFVSCYNRQNGYYSSDLCLLYLNMNPTTAKIDISDCVRDEID